MVEMALSIVDNFDFQDVVVSLEVPRFSSGLPIFTNKVRRAGVRQHLISSVANTFSEAAADSAAAELLQPSQVHPAPADSNGAMFHQPRA